MGGGAPSVGPGHGAAGPTDGTGQAGQAGHERAGTETDVGERQRHGGRAGRRRVPPERSVCSVCSVGVSAASGRAVPVSVEGPAGDTARLEALLVTALVRDGVNAGAEQRAVAAFVAARESGAHGARTRRRDDWRASRRRFGGRSLRATLGALVAGCALERGGLGRDPGGGRAGQWEVRGHGAVPGAVRELGARRSGRVRWLRRLRCRWDPGGVGIGVRRGDGAGRCVARLGGGGVRGGRWSRGGCRGAVPGVRAGRRAGAGGGRAGLGAAGRRCGGCGEGRGVLRGARRGRAAHDFRVGAGGCSSRDGGCSGCRPPHGGGGRHRPF
ncbi:hypothetical protein GA0115245_119419 [Streptomyces sp. di188]|nr:hypothetical protein GA0115245_119419 [Streptomyces sp. di188]